MQIVVTDTSPGTTRDRTRVLLAALILAAVTLVGYRGSFSGEFVLDDELSVVDNPSIRRLSSMGSVLSPPATSTMGGRPVANLTFAINHALGGLQVRGYHVTDLAIHVCAALCLFGIVRRTLARGTAVRPGSAPRSNSDGDVLSIAAAAAVVWALHPVHTGTVAYISQRTEQLMGLFYFLTLYTFMRGVERSSAAWLSLSVVACALGMGSKEVMVTAPVAVLLHDRTFVAGSFRAAWQQRSRYYLSLAATWVILAGLMSTGLNQRAVGYGLGVSWWRYALTECQVIPAYFRLAVWPHPLVFDYGPSFVRSVAEGLPWAFLMMAIGAAVLIALRWRPVAGYLSAGFLLVLAPTSSVVPVATQPMAESRIYVPLAFVITLGVVALWRALGRTSLALIAAGAAGLGLTTAARNEILADPIRLWRDTVAKRPENPRAHSNFGAKLFARDRTDEAIAHAREAIRIEPRSARARSNLAAALIKKGNFDEAIEQARTALQLSPEMSDANYQLGNALIHLGRVAEAVPHYRAEIALRPDFPDAHSNLGAALYRLGRPGEAIGHFEAALRLRPDATDARDNLASALSQAGRRNEAIEIFRASLESRPDAVSLRCNLATILAQAGRLDEAEEEFRAALRLRPDFAPAREGLAQLQAWRAQQGTRKE